MLDNKVLHPDFLFLATIYQNLFATAVSLFVIGLLYFLLIIFWVRKTDGHFQKRKMRIRLFYIASVIFLFLMAHVWVQGFTHLLTVLGLVSAGLVVTNKETIMNFVGWLVITWRGLFAEEDLIQIQQYKGYVKRIGILYITLHEVSDSGTDITGRLIRVPNGLIANNALVNFSQTFHFLEQRFTMLLTPDNDFNRVKQQVKAIIENALSEYYQDKREFTADYLSKHRKQLSSRIRLGTKIVLRPKADNLSIIELVARYFCFSQDIEKIQEKVLLAILAETKSGAWVTLA